MRPSPSSLPDEAIPQSLAAARQAAAVCTRCPLYLNATQTVFGEGPDHAPLFFLGEQPGDREDIEGHPFVGPAGKLFDACLAEAGIDRGKCYVSNAVKHFKNEPRGKRRLHRRPNAGEIHACKWWLNIERELVKPRLLVALGATAAGALTGNAGAILKRRGFIERPDKGPPVLITVHPSSLLRIPDTAEARLARQRFVADLKRVLAEVPDAA